MELRDRGKRLEKAADRVKVEPFLFMAEDGTFSKDPDIFARVSIVDRFLSNFHKPLQRRMLFTKPSDPMPATCVMKHQITGQIYLLGQERYDADGTSEYERLHVIHLVTSDSSAYTDVTKYAKLPDDSEESMVLSPVNVGKFHLSFEYQSSRTEKYSDYEQSTRMLFYSSSRFLKVADELCEFTYNGKVWSIKQVFYDSGFASGIVIDTGQRIETYHIVKPADTYDPTAGTWDFMTNAELIPFSAAYVEDSESSSINEKYGSTNVRTLYVKAQFKYSDNFENGMIILFKDGSTYRITNINNNRRSPDLQITLTRIVNSYKINPQTIPVAPNPSKYMAPPVEGKSTNGSPEDGKY